MATRVHSAGWGYRLGRGVRHVLGGYTRSELQMADWLASNGLPSGIAWAAIWAVRLSVVAVLLYAAFWITLLLLFGVAATATARNTTWDEDGTLFKWRYGQSGYGLYTSFEQRVDGPENGSQ